MRGPNSTRRRCTALAVKDTSTNGPVFAATPKGDGPRPQDRRGGVRTRGAPFTSAQRSRILVQVVAHRKVQSADTVRVACLEPGTEHPRRDA